MQYTIKMTVDTLTNGITDRIDELLSTLQHSLLVTGSALFGLLGLY
jgi:hypothetical protein